MWTIPFHISLQVQFGISLLVDVIVPWENMMPSLLEISDLVDFAVIKRRPVCPSESTPEPFVVWSSIACLGKQRSVRLVLSHKEAVLSLLLSRQVWFLVILLKESERCILFIAFLCDLNACKRGGSAHAVRFFHQGAICWECSWLEKSFRTVIFEELVSFWCFYFRQSLSQSLLQTPYCLWEFNRLFGLLCFFVLCCYFLVSWFELHQCFPIYHYFTSLLTFLVIIDILLQREYICCWGHKGLRWVFKTLEQTRIRITRASTCWRWAVKSNWFFLLSIPSSCDFFEFGFSSHQIVSYLPLLRLVFARILTNRFKFLVKFFVERSRCIQLERLEVVLVDVRVASLSH